MKKKVDNRIRTLINNGMANRHRSFFVLVGDKGREQVCAAHHHRTDSSSCLGASAGDAVLVLLCHDRLSTCTTSSAKLLSSHADEQPQEEADEADQKAGAAGSAGPKQR
jgi:hypothetical protein